MIRRCPFLSNQYLWQMKLIVSLIVAFLCLDASAQNDTARVFNLSLEFRPRLEYRDGFAQLPNDSTTPAAFISNRARLKLDYEQKKFKLHLSVQDVRVWGEEGLISTEGNLGVFEAYVEPFFTKEWSIRIGRQTVELDNGRLFGQANWNQTSRAHEGVNLIYSSERLKSELMGFYSQNAEQVFGSSYTNGSDRYKILSVHYLKVKLSDKWNLTTLNSFDGFESLYGSDALYVRGTSGGRIDFKHKGFAATLSGYYQYGHSNYAQKISAFYLQPEFSLSTKHIDAKLGMEYVSGRNSLDPFKQTSSFSTLYGAAFKFMGNLNYFVRFPSDAQDKGLINPYLKLSFKISDKFKLISETHAFLTEKYFYGSSSSPGPVFLGVENDFQVKYKVNDFISIHTGVAVMFASPSMELIKGGDSARTPVYSYFMVTFTPNLFESVTKYKK
jgi:hypothetical protein